MKTIELTQGKVTFVDDDVYEWASQFKWYAFKSHGSFYAARGVNKRGKVTLFFLHREILGAPFGVPVDHKDGDGLNNLTENIRLCSPAQNSQNKKRRSDNTSGYRGVWMHLLVGKWTSQIVVEGKKHCLGYFKTSQEAAHAYDAAARRLHGAFARLNFP